jgi:hypothetical protein
MMLVGWLPLQSSLRWSEAATPFMKDMIAGVR